MTRTTYWASATYEFEELAPETVKLEIQAPNHARAAFLAVKALRQAHPNRRPTSLVVVLDLSPLPRPPNQTPEGLK